MNGSVTHSALALESGLSQRVAWCVNRRAHVACFDAQCPPPLTWYVNRRAHVACFDAPLDVVPSVFRDQLAAVFDVVTVVNVLDSRDTVNLALLTRPDLGITFTKLHCWRLTQFSKCVFLDADTLVSVCVCVCVCVCGFFSASYYCLLVRACVHMSLIGAVESVWLHRRKLCVCVRACMIHVRGVRVRAFGQHCLLKKQLFLSDKYELDKAALCVCACVRVCVSRD